MINIVTSTSLINDVLLINNEVISIFCLTICTVECGITIYLQHRDSNVLMRADYVASNMTNVKNWYVVIATSHNNDIQCSANKYFECMVKFGEHLISSGFNFSYSTQLAIRDGAPNEFDQNYQHSALQVLLQMVVIIIFCLCMVFLRISSVLSLC